MRNPQEESIIFDTVLQRLKCNSQSCHVILYSSPEGFEYNIETGKIRPLNSVLWYDPLKEDKSQSFVSFLTSYCRNKLDELEDDGYSQDLIVGVFENGCLSINLDKFKHEILEKGKRHNLEESFNSFEGYLKYLYVRNQKLLSYIIEMQQDLL